MQYVLKRASRFYFSRRVPLKLRHLDSREYVRMALNTDSPTTAQKLAHVHNHQLEQYWRSLTCTNGSAEQSAYLQAIKITEGHGLPYIPMPSLVQADMADIFVRLKKIEDKQFNPVQTKAILGAVKKPEIRLSDLFTKYRDLSSDKLRNKSPNQIRKWERPRQLAVNNLVSCIGNKDLKTLDREDMVAFQKWWIDRLKKENLKANSANKNIVQLKVMVDEINKSYKLGLDVDHVFRKLVLSEDDAGKKLPFETTYIKETLLNHDNLKGLNEQAKWVLFAMAETGAGLTELTGLLPEEILMDHDIPHIAITRRKGHRLKTKYRERKIPLVGYALEAFKACPEGFTHYRDRPDALSAVLGKYLNDNDLLPSDSHTVNSLRHSFQDRILAVNAPDRVQAELMGHKFQRQAYGNGASLEQKLEWVEKAKVC